MSCRDDEDHFEFCKHCEDHAPLNGYFHCPICDAEYLPDDFEYEEDAAQDRGAQG